MDVGVVVGIKDVKELGVRTSGFTRGPGEFSKCDSGVDVFSSSKCSRGVIWKSGWGVERIFFVKRLGGGWREGGVLVGMLCTGISGRGVVVWGE